MNTIKLYKWTNFQAVDGWDQKYGFSTDGVMSFDFVGEVDEAREYILPEGFHVAESNMGTEEIYDSKGRHYEIGAANGKPTLVSGGVRVHLSEAHTLGKL